MNRFLQWCAIAMLATLAACSGGGGGGKSDTSISLDKASLAFDTLTDSGINPPAQRITASFVGDGIVVGTPPNTGLPSWLSVSVESNTTNTAQIRFEIFPYGLNFGNHNATVRILTGRSDGSDIKYKDVLVTLRLREGLDLSTNVLNFTAVEGIGASGQTVQLSNDASSWSWNATVDGDWIELNQASGTGPATVTVTAKPSVRGNYTGHILFTATGEPSRRVEINYTATPAYQFGDLATFELNETSTETDIVATLSLNTLSPGSAASWNIQPSVDWLTVEPASGTLGENHELTVRLVPEKLRTLANATYQGMLDFAVSTSSIANTSTPVNMTINVDRHWIVTGSLSINADAGSTVESLTDTVSIDSSTTGVFRETTPWQAIGGNGQFSITKATGDNESNKELTITGNAVSLATAPVDVESHDIVLHSTDSRFVDQMIPASIVVNIPTVSGVAPYVAFDAQSNTAIVRGKAFSNQPALDVRVGNVAAERVSVINDTTMKISYPALAAGQNPTIYVANQLTSVRSTAALKVVAPPAVTDTTITLPQADYYQLAYDQQRHQIMLGGAGVWWGEPGHVRRYFWNGANWETDILALNRVKSLALSHEGSQWLVMLQEDGDSDVVLQHINADTFTVASTETISSTTLRPGTPRVVAPMNDGRTLLISQGTYTSFQMSAGQRSDHPYFFWSVDAKLPWDLSGYFAGDSQAPNAYWFNAHDDSAIEAPRNGEIFLRGRTAATRHRERVVINGAVYNESLQRLGFLQDENAYVGFLIPAIGMKGYSQKLSQSTDGWGVDFIEFDLSGNGPTFNKTGRSWRVTLGWSESEMRGMAITDDGQAILLLTPTRLFVKSLL